MNRMAKNAPPATMAVALIANKTRKLSFIRAGSAKRPPRGNAEAAVGTLQAPGEDLKRDGNAGRAGRFLDARPVSSAGHDLRGGSGLPGNVPQYRPSELGGHSESGCVEPSNSTR